MHSIIFSRAILHYAYALSISNFYYKLYYGKAISNRIV